MLQKAPIFHSLQELFFCQDRCFDNDFDLAEPGCIADDLLDLAADSDIVNKSGAWYQYNGEKIGQGRENAKLYLEQNPEICESVDRKIREHYGLIEGEAADEAEPADTGKKPGGRRRADDAGGED